MNRTVLYPKDLLLDGETLSLRFKIALKRIFLANDLDGDGLLNYTEFKNFQIKSDLETWQCITLTKANQTVVDEQDGITFTAFASLHQQLIQEGSLEEISTMLSNFGYKTNLILLDVDMPSFARFSDQNIELTHKTIQFLKRVYELDSNLQQVEEIFFTALPPASPYNDAVQKPEPGGLSLDAFLSGWALMALLDPDRCVENLIYLGCPDPSSAMRKTWRKVEERWKQRSERNVFYGFVFGAAEAGKSALMDDFLGRPFVSSYSPTTNDRYAVNVVNLKEGSKTLVLREIPEDKVANVNSSLESPLPDIALFVYESSKEDSFMKAKKMLLDFTRHFDIPCMLVASKAEQKPFESEAETSMKVKNEMEIEAPLYVSAKNGQKFGFHIVVPHIVMAAKHPHLRIPETEFRRRKRMVQWCLAVGGSMTLVALAFYHRRAIKALVVHHVNVVKDQVNLVKERAAQLMELGSELVAITRVMKSSKIVRFWFGRKKRHN